MDKQIKQLIEEAIQEVKRLRKEKPDMFPNVPPVLWFGNIEEHEKDKVLVISANPNHPDEPSDDPRIPSSKEWKKGEVKIEKLCDDCNHYFSHKNRYTNWFGDHHVKPDNDKRQGRIENFLNGMDASFYGTKNRHAIHIDLLPFSTYKSFTKIADDLLRIPGITAWIDKHVRDLTALIKPKIVIINGISNFEYFNLCVNMGMQPYQICKYDNTTIWRASQRPGMPIIVGISTNMGSGCRKTWKEIYALGQHVSNLIDSNL